MDPIWDLMVSMDTMIHRATPIEALTEGMAGPSGRPHLGAPHQGILTVVVTGFRPSAAANN